MSFIFCNFADCLGGKTRTHLKTLVTMVITIISIIITIASIITTIVVCVKRKKYPVSINFYVQDAVRLTNPLMDNFQNIALTYNGQKTNQSVSYVQALFCNTGDEDIRLSEDTVEQGISIKLPNGYKWLEVQIKEKTEVLNVSIDIDQEDKSVVHVSGGLFRRDEIFSFDAFVEGELTRDNYRQNIQVSHRFSNTEDIRVEEMYPIEKKEERKLFYKSSVIGGVLALIMLGFMAYILLTDKPVNYIEKGAASDMVYSAHVYNQDTIIVTKFEGIVWPWNSNKYSIQEFKNKFEVNTYTSSVLFWMVSIFASIYGLLLLVALGAICYLSIKDRTRNKVRMLYSQLVSEEQLRINNKETSEK